MNALRKKGRTPVGAAANHRLNGVGRPLRALRHLGQQHGRKRALMIQINRQDSLSLAPFEIAREVGRDRRFADAAL